MSSSSKPTSSCSSILTTESTSHTSSTSKHNTPLFATASLKKAVKAPFQGWSKELLWAREGIDDDYNFTSGTWGDVKRSHSSPMLWSWFFSQKQEAEFQVSPWKEEPPFSSHLVAFLKSSNIPNLLQLEGLELSDHMVAYLGILERLMYRFTAPGLESTDILILVPALPVSVRVMHFQKTMNAFRRNPNRDVLVLYILCRHGERMALNLFRLRIVHRLPHQSSTNAPASAPATYGHGENFHRLFFFLFQAHLGACSPFPCYLKLETHASAWSPIRALFRQLSRDQSDQGHISSHTTTPTMADSPDSPDSPVSPISNMPSHFAAEIEKLDPEVPFRASPAHIHHTWARTFHSRPELYIRPRSIPEIQKIVTMARRMRRRIVTVGSGHSPSDLTCTSAWMVNLDDFGKVLGVHKVLKRVMVQAGIRMHAMNLVAKEQGLTMPTLGSIDEQSLAGAIGTGTHGSSMSHGLLSDSVCSLRIVLANGQVVKCSPTQSPDLFRAALVSLGALGIIVEIEFQLVEQRRIEWVQTIVPIEDIFANWNNDLWTSDEFVRVWWLPYMRRAIIWRASATSKPERAAAYDWYGGSVGFHTYHVLLWISQYVPRFLPWVEWFVFGMQYGFKNTTSSSGVEDQRTGLLMNCLYSQFVNEWSIPLSDGPEALDRLTKWIHGDEKGSGLPFSPKGVYVHSPIEVRVANTVGREPRPYLDTAQPDTPSLYINATLYRPYGEAPPCHERYYEAFEYLMKEYKARPHWAKNHKSIDHGYLTTVYGEDLDDYLKVRKEVDPEGMFVGAWHRRTILPTRNEQPTFPLEEKEVVRRERKIGGDEWVGEQARWWDGGADVFEKGGSESGESFDLMAEAEAEKSVLLENVWEDNGGEVEKRVREGPDGRRGGENVFDKM
ncbi:hypothetical protein K504DRAFT_446560 [Pleomassaria siparia CBS 279.74]|uniref:D-arabinono-1,4-lactone oxidase n=1 Tax=Pleomassaria siparia CBS 279.74 TaxID=1314801 RepID=A0A6G1KSC0_9PLEO|nr:hypothetical protein K504DRAFT_446560 [Pleomassaria siparia CBS 279.74]